MLMTNDELESKLKDHRRHSDSIISEILAISQENKTDIKHLSEALVEHMKDEGVELSKVLQRLDTISQEDHSKHHSYLDAVIRQQEERAKFWHDQKSRLATATMWGIIVITASAFWYIITDFLKNRGISL